MTGEAKTTTDPETIPAWVEAHGGRPARVRGTGDGDDDDPGILRIDFPGGAGDDSASGEDSTFFKLVERQGD
jgi:hypothetical protein